MLLYCVFYSCISMIAPIPGIGIIFRYLHGNHTLYIPFIASTFLFRATSSKSKIQILILVVILLKRIELKYPPWNLHVDEMRYDAIRYDAISSFRFIGWLISLTRCDQWIAPNQYWPGKSFVWRNDKMWRVVFFPGEVVIVIVLIQQSMDVKFDSFLHMQQHFY